MISWRRQSNTVLLAAALTGGAGCQAFFGAEETDADPIATQTTSSAASSGGVTCGDGECESSEDCVSCPEDCARASCLDRYEPNDESPQGTVLTLDQKYCDVGICAGEQDWFAFEAPPATHVEIEYEPAVGELDLEIYDPTYVAGSYDETGIDGVALSQLAPGAYWGRVYGKADDPQIENPCYCVRVSSR